MSDTKIDVVVRGFAKTVRQKLGDSVETMFLFGSRARGEAWQGSDYDVAVVVDKRDATVENGILDATVQVLDEHDALVSAHVFSAKEWAVEKGSPLGLNVSKEGIPI